VTAEERKSWLESRRKGLGSSDIAPIIGLSPWKDSLGIYLSKIGQADENAMTPQQSWGLRLEPAMAAAVMDEYGWTLAKVPSIIHREHRFLLASPDRMRTDGANEVVEFKTSRSSDGWGEPETDEIPLYYQVQVQHQMEVCHATYEVETAWVFVLIGGSDFRRYRIPYDPEFLPTVLPALEEFWHRVETRTPPEPDWSHPTTLENLQSLYAPVVGKSVALDAEMVQYATEYVQLGAEASAVNARRDEAKARLIAAMGDAELAALPDGRAITRRKVERKGFTVEPTSYFNFSIKEPKHGK